MKTQKGAGGGGVTSTFSVKEKESESLEKKCDTYGKLAECFWAVAARQVCKERTKISALGEADTVSMNRPHQAHNLSY